MERLDEYRMARRGLMAKVSGGRVRGRPRVDWMDGVKVALGNRRVRQYSLFAEAERQYSNERKEWRAMVHIYN